MSIVDPVAWSSFPEVIKETIGAISLGSVSLFKTIPSIAWSKLYFLIKSSAISVLTKPGAILKDKTPFLPNDLAIVFVREIWLFS